MLNTRALFIIVLVILISVTTLNHNLSSSMHSIYSKMAVKFQLQIMSLSMSYTNNTECEMIKCFSESSMY